MHHLGGAAPDQTSVTDNDPSFWNRFLRLKSQDFSLIYSAMSHRHTPLVD